MLEYTKKRAWHWWLTSLWTAIYVGSVLHHTNGHLSLPLDDPFIYFQYARQAADGFFLQYNTGEAATTGATSLVYMLLLLPAFWLGIDGMGIVVYAVGLGAVFLGLCGRELRLIGRQLDSAFAGDLACVLFLLCGPLLWGFLSGMEIGLFSFALLLAFRQVICAAFWPAIGAVALLVVARPEGVLLYILLLFWLVLAGGWAGQKNRWAWALPALVVLAQALLYKTLTDSFGSTGLAAKWRLNAPHLSIAEVARHILFDYAGYIKGLLGGSLGHQTSANLYAYDGNYRRIVFAPFFLLFFLAELTMRVAGEWRQKKAGPAVLAALWLGIGILATCTLVEYDAHYHRYQQPFLPLFILYAALAIARLRRIGLEWAENLAGGLASFFALWGLVSALFFAVAYGENSADIYFLQVQMGRFIDDNLPADARVAINDAGAIRFFGKRPTVDLVGLTTAGFSRSWRHGSGSIYERLEAMPADRRPGFFALFPNWFSFPSAAFLRPIHSIRLLQPSIVDAEKVLYQAQWQEGVDASRPQNMAMLKGKPLSRIVAEVDVADLDSEAEHHYRSTVRIRGEGQANLLLALRAGNEGQQLIDGGRTVTGSEYMRVKLVPQKRAHLLMRTVSGIRQHFEVYCNGELVGQVQLPGGQGRGWIEMEVAEIDAQVHRGEAEIELRPIGDGGALSPIVSFHYWLLQ